VNCKGSHINPDGTKKGYLRCLPDNEWVVEFYNVTDGEKKTSKMQGGKSVIDSLCGIGKCYFIYLCL